jgi:hypothetical protein
MITQLLAYIDPTIGATLTQLILAGAVGVGAVVKLKWHSIKRVVTRSETVTDGAEETDATVDDEANTS